MARKKNLAGLAALAGLAYVASRDKAAKAGDTTAPTAVPTAPTVAAPEMDPMEAANASLESQKIMEDAVMAGNQEKGSRMLDEMRDAESAPRPRTRSLTPRAPTAVPTARPTAADSDYNLNYSNEGRGRRRAAPTAPGSELKKGGSVKGWGMARGARKAKTY